LVVVPFGENWDVNGVIIELEKPDQFDEREYNYNRMMVRWEVVEFLRGSFKIREGDVLWIYALKEIEDLKCPSIEFQIAQSYVDICISGFYRVGGESFAKEFLQKTYGWNQFVLMNRGQLTSAGRISETEMLKTIDRLLQQCHLTLMINQEQETNLESPMVADCGTCFLGFTFVVSRYYLLVFILLLVLVSLCCGIWYQSYLPGGVENESIQLDVDPLQKSVSLSNKKL